MVRQIYENVAMDQLVVHEVTLNEPPAGNQGSLPTLLKKLRATPERQSKPSRKIPLKPRITEEENIQPKIKTQVHLQMLLKTNQIPEPIRVPPKGLRHLPEIRVLATRYVVTSAGCLCFAGCDELGGSLTEIKKCSEQRLLGFLSNLRYPSQAIKIKQKGSWWSIYCGEDGSISNIQILKDIGDGCGAETIRVLELINTMRYGHLVCREARVRVRYTLPVEFQGS
ncbi:MAG: hypothetical protein U0T81_18225 [Saprospiraceae bacterium]